MIPLDSLQEARMIDIIHSVDPELAAEAAAQIRRREAERTSLSDDIISLRDAIDGLSARIHSGRWTAIQEMHRDCLGFPVSLVQGMGMVPTAVLCVAALIIAVGFAAPRLGAVGLYLSTSPLSITIGQQAIAGALNAADDGLADSRLLRDSPAQ